VGLVVLGGCREHRAIREAQHLVSDAAQSVELADLEFAALYEDAAASCLAASDTREAYDLCMARWDEGARLILKLRYQIHQVQVGLDSWKHGAGPDDFKSAACHFLETAATLRELAPLDIYTGGMSC